MRPLHTRILSLVLMALVGACGGSPSGEPGPEVTEPYEFSLTAKGADYQLSSVEALFDLSLTSGDPTALAFDKLRVTVGSTDATPTVMAIELATDAGKAQQFDTGDVLTVSEPSATFIKGQDVGTSMIVTVGLLRSSEEPATYAEIKVLSWTP